MSLFLLDGANLALGIVKGALDEYRELTASKRVPGPPFGLRSHDADYHRWYG